MSTNKKIEVGDEVKDTVTGFKGIAVAKYSYLQGCDRIEVQPPVRKDGKVPDSHSFDEPQLKILKRAKVKPATKAQRTTGGPAPYLPTAKGGKPRR